MTKTILNGHLSPDTAHVCTDYPYGRLRCTRISWIEADRTGEKFRICHQTTNPKTGRVNKPKKSTYAYLAGVMYLDENDHLVWAAHSMYSSAAESIAFLEEYRAGLTDQMESLLTEWIASKQKFEGMLESGEAYFTINGARV